MNKYDNFFLVIDKLLYLFIILNKENLSLINSKLFFFINFFLKYKYHSDLSSNIIIYIHEIRFKNDACWTRAN